MLSSLRKSSSVPDVSFSLFQVFTRVTFSPKCPLTVRLLYRFAYLLCWQLEREKGLVCTRTFSCHEVLQLFVLFFFLSILFFYPRHSPTPTAHTYDPPLLPTPTTHDPLPTTTTSTHYPRWSFHMWRYHVFAWKLTWCFIPVYITIIHDLSHTFFKRNYYEVKLHVKLALRFLQITAKHQDCPFFTVFLTIKTSSSNISITL